MRYFLLSIECLKPLAFLSTRRLLWAFMHLARIRMSRVASLCAQASRSLLELLEGATSSHCTIFCSASLLWHLCVRFRLSLRDLQMVMSSGRCEIAICVLVHQDSPGKWMREEQGVDVVLRRSRTRRRSSIT